MVSTPEVMQLQVESRLQNHWTSSQRPITGTVHAVV